jgi:hypothetical protein
MLDPLTALSLASSIVQIVDFSIELVTDGVELYNKGSLSNYNELEQATLHLTELTKALSSPVQFNITQPGIVPKPLSQNEARLQGLAKSCRELGEQLLAMLDEVKRKNLGIGWRVSGKQSEPLKTRIRFTTSRSA